MRLGQRPSGSLWKRPCAAATPPRTHMLGPHASHVPEPGGRPRGRGRVAGCTQSPVRRSAPCCSFEYNTSPLLLHKVMFQCWPPSAPYCNCRWEISFHHPEACTYNPAFPRHYQSHVGVTGLAFRQDPAAAPTSCGRRPNHLPQRQDSRWRGLRRAARGVRQAGTCPADLLTCWLPLAGEAGA